MKTHIRYDKHHTPLRVQAGGKTIWKCAYSHQRRFEDMTPATKHCNNCGANYPRDAHHRCP